MSLCSRKLPWLHRHFRYIWLGNIFILNIKSIPNPASIPVTESKKMSVYVSQVIGSQFEGMKHLKHDKAAQQIGGTDPPRHSIYYIMLTLTSIPYPTWGNNCWNGAKNSPQRKKNGINRTHKTHAYKHPLNQFLFILQFLQSSPGCL